MVGSVVYWMQYTWEGTPCIRKNSQKATGKKFYGAFSEKVGCKPEYLRQKLAGGMQEAELRRLYDMLAVEIAMKARCTAIRYDALQLEPASENGGGTPRPPRSHARGSCLRTLRWAHGAAHRTDRRTQKRNSGAAPTTRPASTRRTF